MYGSEIKCERLVLTAGTAQYVSGFSCGIESIDLSEYLAFSALHDEDNVTYLYVDSDKQKAIAYASISCSMLSYGADRAASAAILIDKFAVDQAYQHMRYAENEGYKLSQVIFWDLLDIITQIASYSVGAKYSILYSTPEAHGFYTRCGFSDFDQYMERDKHISIADCIPMYYRLPIER